MTYGCVWRCSYWTTAWTIKTDLEFALEYSYFSRHWTKLTGIDKRKLETLLKYWKIINRMKYSRWRNFEYGWFRISNTSDKKYLTMNRKIWIKTMYCVEILSVIDLVWKGNDILIQVIKRLKVLLEVLKSFFVLFSPLLSMRLLIFHLE